MGSKEKRLEERGSEACDADPPLSVTDGEAERRTVRVLVQAAFAPVLDEPIPEKILALLRRLYDDERSS